MVLTSEQNLRAVIQPRVPDLSPALRRAADFVLRNPETIAMRSLRQVAEDSDVRAPTYSRLARSLGFETFEELRELCRQEVQQQSISFAAKASALQARENSGAGKFLPSHAAASIRNIERMVQTIDMAELTEAADVLSKARNVVLFGALSSGPLIDFLAYTAGMALPNWRAAPRNHESVAAALVDLRPDDVVLVLSHQPCARSAVEAAASGARAGATVIACSDSYSAPTTHHADYVFITPTESPHFFASEVALVLLFEALLGMVVRRSGKVAQQRIALMERENHRSGEYWQADRSSAASRKGEPLE